MIISRCIPAISAVRPLEFLVLDMIDITQCMHAFGMSNTAVTVGGVMGVVQRRIRNYNTSNNAAAVLVHVTVRLLEELPRDSA